ncbi:hypothetical protein AB1Y20_018243 [Prymnesium parvum]|uniref:Pru domain-containing protein n=1 Tax=Prymnesium parvum TaxID=97485 RepID=A0AB34JNP6_PRYPA
MAMSMFGAPAANSNSLCQMKAGKMTLVATTVTADPRKGLLILRKSDDGLMHLIWQERTTGTIEDDLIVFPGDATLRQIPACKDGFAMVLEFATGRKLFFWSQEMRKKGSDWTKAEDIAKETELMTKANSYLTGRSGPTPAAAPGGFGGMTHAELMAMLSGPSGIAQPAVPAPASTMETGVPTPAPSAPAAVEPSTSSPAPAAPAPTFTTDAISSLLGSIAPPPASATAPQTSAPAPSAAATFSADAISSILSGITVPPGPPAAAPTANFSASSISSILGSITAQNQPLTLNEVIHPERTAPLVDSAMEAQLAEHLPATSSDDLPETAVETLSTPQLQQEATDAARDGNAASGMDVDSSTSAPAPDGESSGEKMDES